jgi:hypothetical protein
MLLLNRPDLFRQSQICLLPTTGLSVKPNIIAAKAYPEYFGHLLEGVPFMVLGHE